MELFDFYRLLQVPVGTPIEDIKKAYILKVHQYSQAYKNGDEKAAEYLGIITKGYGFLADPDRKRLYDLMLLSYYLKKKNSDINRSFYRKYGHSERNPVLGEGEDEGDEDFSGVHGFGEGISEELEEKAKKGIRGELLAMIIGGVLFAILMYFFNKVYWQPYTDLKMVSYVLMTVAYVILMLWMLMKIYRYFEVRNIVLQKRISSEKWILVCFLVMFFAIPALALKTENILRNYHINHYAKVTRASDFMLEDNWLTVQYTVSGKHYTQSVSLGDNAENFKKYYYDTSKFFIKYSEKDPKIIKIDLPR